jgi:hypothetical protein
MTNLSHRQGRVFPEIQWTPERIADREVEREAFYQRCYPIFDRIRAEKIATHHNWFVAIEPIMVIFSSIWQSQRYANAI